MVRSVAQHARDDAPLFGYPQALLVTKGLNIDRLSHARSLGPADTKGKSPRPYFRLQRPPRPLFTLGTLRTQDDLHRQGTALLRIVGRNHRILSGKSPFGARKCKRLHSRHTCVARMSTSARKKKNNV